jgi:hypothetical protein
LEKKELRLIWEEDINCPKPSTHLDLELITEISVRQVRSTQSDTDQPTSFDKTLLDLVTTILTTIKPSPGQVSLPSELVREEESSLPVLLDQANTLLP